MLAALVLNQGEGAHQLSIVAERTRGTTATAELSLSVTGAPLQVSHGAEEYLRFLALLTFALEYSTVRHAVLVATTADEPGPRACGWTVRAGWLRPVATGELQAAALRLPGIAVYAAPALCHPDEPSEGPAMSDKPAATPDGYCTNKEPVRGTIRTINASAIGPKFSHLHGRRMAQCPCGRETSLTDRGNLRRHKQPQE
ncbi:hypothetical protein [Streptomyces sp. NPDC094149]|uniref:hypothetical protein n=1 Tax=Streptomyces sp. NPDC094149 TaxID=3155079 RepID=UPI00331E9C43